MIQYQGHIVVFKGLGQGVECVRGPRLISLVLDLDRFQAAAVLLCRHSGLRFRERLAAGIAQQPVLARRHRKPAVPRQWSPRY